MATPAPYTGTATGFKKALGWYSDTEVNAPTPAPTAAPTIQKPLVGPLAPGATRPTTEVPNPALTPAPPKTQVNAPQNGTLQGPYPVYNANGGTSVQQGMNVVNGVMQPNTPAPGNQQQTPAPTLYQDQYARTPEQIQELARQRIQAKLQAGRTAAGGALTGAKNAYDYMNQVEGDSRTLRNADFKETNNPFSGKFAYDKTNMLRNDTIQDTAQDKDYNAQVGLINQKLADLEAAAPGDEQAIIDELTQIERQTGISVAQLQEQQKNNQFNQGMQNKQFNQQQQVIDYNQSPNNPNNIGQALQNQLAQLKLDNYPEETRQAAQLFEQQLKNGQIDQKTAEFKLKELQNPNSPTNQAAKIDLELKKLEAKYAEPEMKARLEQIRKQTAQIGAAPYQSETDRQYDQVRLDTAKKQLEILNGKADVPKAIDPKESTDNLTFYQGQIDSRPNLTKEQKMSYASSQKAGLSVSDYNKLVEYIKQNS